MQIAVILLYIQGIFGLISGLGGGLVFVLSLIFSLGMIASAVGIANGKRAGWVAGIVLSILSLALTLWIIAVIVLGPLSLGFTGFIFSLINIAFQVALVVALLHPQSREYQKIWFE